MIPAVESEATSAIRGGFFSLLDSLSALRSLAWIDLRQVSPRQFVSKALTVLTQHQNLENCSVFLREGEQLKCVAGTGFDEEVALVTGNKAPKVPDNARAFSSGEGLIGLTCQTGELQYCRDCSVDERYKQFSDRRTNKARGSLLCVPIRFDAKVLGVLNVSSPLPDYFDVWQQHMLSLFASLMGQMLYNQHLLFDLDLAVQQRTLELQQALEEAETLKQRYQELSTLDELTGLHNRRYFFAEGESVLARAVRYALPFSMMLVDADHFKRINDTWGHTVGDQVLFQIARILANEVRSGDIVARVGGEEFVVVLPNTGSTGVDLTAKRIQRKIAGIEIGEVAGPMGVTVSIGMTTLDSANTERDTRSLLEQLYSQSDRAMYECKRQGRNRRMMYQPGWALEGPE